MSGFLEAIGASGSRLAGGSEMAVSGGTPVESVPSCIGTSDCEGMSKLRGDSELLEQVPVDKYSNKDLLGANELVITDSEVFHYIK